MKTYKKIVTYLEDQGFEQRRWYGLNRRNKEDFKVITMLKNHLTGSVVSDITRYVGLQEEIQFRYTDSELLIRFGQQRLYTFSFSED